MTATNSRTEGQTEPPAKQDWPAFVPLERAGIVLAILVSVGLLVLVHPWARPKSSFHGMAEGIAAAGTIRTALRVYAEKHGGSYPILENASGNDLAVIGLDASYFNGKYFRPESFVINSSATAYIISAANRETGETYIINSKGEELGTYRTGQ